MSEWLQGWRRVIALEAEAKRLQAEAKALEESLVAAISETACPSWCAGPVEGDPLNRHEWRSRVLIHAGRDVEIAVAARTHRGPLNTWLVEQTEFIDADGTRWLAAIDRISRLRRTAGVER